MKHTDLPWELRTVGETPMHFIRGKGNLAVAKINIEANAAFIVKAVNSHAILLKLAKQHYSRLLSLGQYEGRHTKEGQAELAELRDIIALCEGVTPQEVQEDFEEAELIKSHFKQAEAE